MTPVPLSFSQFFLPRSPAAAARGGSSGRPWERFLFFGPNPC